MMYTKSLRHKRRGGVLALSLIAVTVVSIIGGGFLLMTATLGRSQKGDLERSQAFYLAEAGLAESYASLAMGKTGNVGSRAAPALYGNGLFWVEAAPVGEKRIQLTSTGMSGSMRVVVSLVAEKTLISTSALGVFAQSPLELPAGSLVDGYDSTWSTYAEQAALGLDATKGGRVGSNGGIAVGATQRAPTLLNGDAAPGPGAALQLAPHATMTGDTLPAAAAVEPPPPKPPEIELLPAVVVKGGTPQVLLASGSYGLEGLELQGDSSVTLQGPAVLVTRALRLLDTSRLVFDASGGKIDIYVLDALSVASAASLGGGNTNPAAVTVQYAGQDPIGFQSAHPFYGTLYAPGATVTTGPGFELFGSVVADRIVLAPGARLHFDRALLAQAGGEQALPEILAWRLVDLGPESGGRMNSSPFQTLGLDPADLTGPSHAHADQALDIIYVDLGDQTQSYSGAESAFDWGSVTEVLTLQRDGEVVLLGTAAAAAPAEAPARAAGVEQAVLDLFAHNPPLPSSDLKSALEDMEPLSAQALAYMLALPGEERLKAGDVKNIMNDHAPLEEGALVVALGALFENPDPGLHGPDVKSVLLENSPFPQAVAGALLDDMLVAAANPMSAGETKDVLIANSPLPLSTLSLVTGGRTRLSTSDIRAVLRAQ